MDLRTVAILRAYEPSKACDLALQSWGIGIDLIEVPVQGEAGWAALAAVADTAAGRAFGAGTVLTVEDVCRAVELGASVVISPGLDVDVIEEARRIGALALPGVITPTDVTRAARLGLTTCKLFPASQVGPGWLGAIRGPFPDLRFVAVGGVDLHNAADYLRAGAAGVGFGGSIEGVLAASDPAGVIAELHALVSG